MGFLWGADGGGGLCEGLVGLAFWLLALWEACGDSPFHGLLDL